MLRNRIAAFLLLVFSIFSSATSVFAAIYEENRKEFMKMSEEERKVLLLYFDEEELYVVSTTRSLKSITRIAENVEVVTAEDIELMNAHTVAEALYNVTGVQMANFVGPGVAGTAGIHGSDITRVTVFIDGVPVMNISDQTTTGIIPVQMIDKIEIIKGPASSTWGSSFGGVINIITKSIAAGDHVNGMLSASGGERNTSDLRAEVSGRKDSLGLYLFAGTMNSDGFRGDHGFWQNNFFGKVSVDAGNKTSVDFSFLYHKGNSFQYEVPEWDYYEGRDEENIYGRFGLRSALSGNLVLNLSAWFYRQHTFAYFNALSTGDNFLDGFNSFNQYGASGSLTWRTGIHTLVAGTDLSDGRFKTNFAPDGFVKQWKYALFINDTIIIDRLSIIPGLRYDNMDRGGDFLSPSLGLTYQLSKDLLLKASVARGFHNPSIVEFVEYPGWPVNQDLDTEKIMSYQLGAEANISDLAWLKLVLFRHDIKDLITQIDRDFDDFADFTVNAYEQRVHGGELEVRTKAHKGFTFAGGVSYENIELIDFHTDNQFDVTNRYGINTSVTYNNDKGFRAILKGHYLWWNLPDYWGAKYNGFVLDFNVIKEVMNKKDMSLDLFFTGHNLLNASSYDNNLYVNPSRWIEAGLRFRF